MTAGINYDVKPYIDDGSPLPAVNARVESINEGPHIQGRVISVSSANRTITVTGFQFAIQPGLGIAGSYAYTDVTSVVFLWKNFRATLENSSNAFFARNGT